MHEPGKRLFVNCRLVLAHAPWPWLVLYGNPVFPKVKQVKAVRMGIASRSRPRRRGIAARDRGRNRPKHVPVSMRPLYRATSRMCACTTRLVSPPLARGARAQIVIELRRRDCYRMFCSIGPESLQRLVRFQSEVAKRSCSISIQKFWSSWREEFSEAI